MTTPTNQPPAGARGPVSSTGAPSSIIHGAAAAKKTPQIAMTDRISLVYELLDAHLDTADLAAGFECDERWAAHLGYLRALQRIGRQAVGEMSIEDETRGARQGTRSETTAVREVVL
jgi:hypothetical protein